MIACRDFFPHICQVVALRVLELFFFFFLKAAHELHISAPHMFHPGLLAVIML